MSETQADSRRRLLGMAADMQRDAVMKSIANQAVAEASRELEKGGPQAVQAAYEALEKVAARYGRLMAGAAPKQPQNGA